MLACFPESATLAQNAHRLDADAALGCTHKQKGHVSVKPAAVRANEQFWLSRQTVKGYDSLAGQIRRSKNDINAPV
jgi:hypothetical protein